MTMNNDHKTAGSAAAIACLAALLLPLAAGGCGMGQKKAAQENKDFFTSGNKEADQRADQRMAKTAELRGTGGAGGSEGGGGGGGAQQAAAKVEPAEGRTTASGKPAGDDAPRTLFDRLGGQVAIAKIVDDFVDRMRADPRVNLERKGVIKGGFRFGRAQSMEWNAHPYALAQFKKHMVQFLMLSTGGPSFYDGLDMTAAHANRHINNAEFDAAVGDLKATLDKLAVPAKEQKELLAIVESTRPQVVQER
jgi:hemoglobin